MRSGAAGQVIGSLQTLTESNICTTDERIRLIDVLRETIPRIVPFLMDSSRKESLARLTSLHADAALKDLQPQLGELSEKMEQLSPASGAKSM